MRFTLRSLLGFVAFVGVAFASLMQPWRGWGTSLVLTATVLLLLLAIPAGIFARRRERPFYVGFAVLGWGYLVLAYASWFEATIGRQLLAMRLAEWACVAATDSLGDIEHFVKTTQALFTFGLAVVGGVLTDRWFKHAINDPVPTLDVSRCEDEPFHPGVASLRRAR